jgi:heme-binding protein
MSAPRGKKEGEGMSRVLKRAGIILVLVFVGIQFIRPQRTNPPVDPARTIEAYTNIPPDVHATLRRACMDCHSNETRWPWYSNVAPVSWLLVSHVNEARSHVNLSEWDVRMKRRSGPRPEQLCEEVQSGEMPLTSYLLLHRDARLSKSDVDSICAWAQGVQKGSAPPARPTMARAN